MIDVVPMLSPHVPCNYYINKIKYYESNSIVSLSTAKCHAKKGGLGPSILPLFIEVPVPSQSIDFSCFYDFDTIFDLGIVLTVWYFFIGQFGDQTGLFYTTNPVFYTCGNRFVRRTGTFENLFFFHLSRRTTVVPPCFDEVQGHRQN
jgi:hypothetical protein